MWRRIGRRVEKEMHGAGLWVQLIALLLAIYVLGQVWQGWS